MPLGFPKIGIGSVLENRHALITSGFGSMASQLALLTRPGGGLTGRAMTVSIVRHHCSAALISIGFWRMTCFATMLGDQYVKET